MTYRPITIAFLCLCSISHANTNLRVENGVLKNDYLELEIGSYWDELIISDTDVIASASFLGEDFSNLTVMPLYNTYSSNIFYLEELIEATEKVAEASGGIHNKEFFLTNEGHQAVVVHWEVDVLGNASQYFTFLIDGTTTGYQGTTGNWLYTTITITNSSLSFNDAMTLVKGIKFTEGSPAPARSLPEYEGLNSGESNPVEVVPPEGSNLRVENGVLKNDYLELEIGSYWDELIISDTDVIASASFLGEDFSNLTVMPLYNTYSSNIFYLEELIEATEKVAEASGGIHNKEFFLTNEGHQAVVVHWEVDVLGNASQYFTFLIDGTTTGYQGTTGNWLYTTITITNSSLSFNDAMTLVKGIKFTEGSPAPARSLPEYEGLNSGESNPVEVVPPEGSNLRVENGVLKNDYLELEIGSYWDELIISDTDVIASASFLGEDFSNLTVMPLYNTYSSNIFYLEELIEATEKVAEASGGIHNKEFFLTNEGHQAVVVHWEVDVLGNASQYFTFLIDGTTTGYQGTTGNWLYTTITITNSSLSFNDAMTLVKGIKFTEGSPAPARSLPEYEGLNSGESNNGNNDSGPTEPEAPVVSFRTITDGPLSFSVPDKATVDYTLSYEELDLMTTGFHLITPENSFIPISLLTNTDSMYQSLDEYASHYRESYELSESGSLASAERFTTDSGFNGITLTRDTVTPGIGDTREYMIIVDLTTDAWKQRYLSNEYADQNAWLKVQLNGSMDSLQNGNYETALAIAKSLSFDQTTIPSLPDFNEQNPALTDNSASILSKTITDGPLSFSVPDKATVDYTLSYEELDLMTTGFHLITPENSFIPISLLTNTDSMYQSLDEYASHYRESYELSESGSLGSAIRFTTDSGFNGIALTRNTTTAGIGETREYIIIVDLTTDAWKQRYLSNEYADQNAWLKVQLNGSMDSLQNGNYETALAIAKSLSFDQTTIPSLPDFNEQNPALTDNSASILSKTITDGPLSFSVPDKATVDYTLSYEELDLMTTGFHLITPENSFIPISLLTNTDSMYQSLDEYASHYRESYELSESGSLGSAIRFTTDSGFNGIALTRNTTTAGIGETREYMIIVDLTTDAWKQRYLSNDYADQNAWLKVQLNGSMDSLQNGNYETALAIAKSLSFDQTTIPSLPDFNEHSIELSSSTSFAVSKIAEDWFSSNWFGEFYDTGSGWIYHYDLGWIYSENSDGHGDWYWSDKKGWIWTNENIYPYFFSDSTDDWIFFDSEKSKAYNFQNKEWKDWNELELVVQSKEKKLQQAIGNATTTDEGIINIINSNLSESEKLDGIAEMIFYGL